MFWNNYTWYNPAMAGMQYKHEGSLNYRNQWDKVNGAPNTLTAGYTAKIDQIHGGAGVSGMYETIGFNRISKGLLHYSFHLPLGKSSTLAIGLSAGAYKTKVDLPFANVNSSLQFTANFGVVYTYKQLVTGISVTRFNEGGIKVGPATYNSYRNFWYFAQYTWDVSEQVALKPAVLLGTNFTSTTINASLRAVLKQHYWAGVNYQSNESVGLMIGWDVLGKYRVGYSYDYTTNALSNVSRGTHEVVLGVLFK